ncbi:MAG: type II toxin-antitoxin system VapC family toxin [Saprospiraceae bacterium]
MNYIWDTNIAIYYLNGGLNPVALNFINEIPIYSKPHLSVIAERELLSWSEITDEELKQVEMFIENSFVLPVNEEVKNRTIAIKRHKKIKLPDALIAASAIVYNCTLLSRNEKDFLNIDGLTCINPFK